MSLCLYLSPGGFPVVERHGVPVHLTAAQTRLLAALASDDRLWSKAQLEEAVWRSPFTSPDSAFKMLDVLVCQMRRSAGPELIDTEPEPPARGIRGARPQRWQLGAAVRLFTILGEIARAPGAFPVGEAA